MTDEQADQHLRKAGLSDEKLVEAKRKMLHDTYFVNVVGMLRQVQTIGISFEDVQLAWKIAELQLLERAMPEMDTSSREYTDLEMMLLKRRIEEMYQGTSVDVGALSDLPHGAE
jgi:hypothetical protein